MHSKHTIAEFLRIFYGRYERAKDKALYLSFRENFFTYYARGYGQALRDISNLLEKIQERKHGIIYHARGCCNIPDQGKFYTKNLSGINCEKCLMKIYGDLSPFLKQRMNEVILRVIEAFVPSLTDNYFKKKDYKEFQLDKTMNINDELKRFKKMQIENYEKNYKNNKTNYGRKKKWQ